MGIVEQTVDKVKTTLAEKTCEWGTISGSERMLSVIAGGFILGYSIKKLFKKPLSAISGVALGGGLIARGVTGKCPAAKGTADVDLATVEDDAKLTLIERRYFDKDK